MSDKSDYFFLNVKDVYPSFKKPAAIDEELWEEMFEPFEKEDIRNALKDYRRADTTGFAPQPARFREYLSPYKKSVAEREHLPLSPETYLMREDIKAGRCKHFYPDYVRGVQYVLNDKLKEVIGERVFKTYTPGMKYRAAVDYGLFADFDKVLEIVCKGGH